MGELINLVNIAGDILVSSREIAINFEKEHKNILQSIEEIRNGVAEKSADLFIEGKYQHPQNKQWYKEYLLTEDGFSLLVMGFTGQKAIQWKLKYIEAFKKMKSTLVNQFGNLSKELQAIFTIDKKQQQIEKNIESVKEELHDFQRDIPLFAVECDEITRLVKSIGTRVLGGKSSNSYKNKSIRGRVYSDIYRQLKREFGVISYKAIKRRQLDQALDVVENYILPIHLKEEIELKNRFDNRGDLAC